MSTYCWEVKSLGMLCVGWGPRTGLFWELKAAHSAGPKLPEQPRSHSTSLPRLKNRYNFSFINEWFIWEQRMAPYKWNSSKWETLTHKVPSSVEAEILLRVGCPPHTHKTFSKGFSCYTSVLKVSEHVNDFPCCSKCVSSVLFSLRRHIHYFQSCHRVWWVPENPSLSV
jgi:hypothetical protein